MPEGQEGSQQKTEFVNPKAAEAAEVVHREFLENYRNGIGDVLEMLEFDPETPLSPDPLSMGFDERTMEELTVREKQDMEEILFEELIGDQEQVDASTVRTYQSQAPEQAAAPGTIDVSVFHTKHEEVFLQQMTSADGEKRFVVGPDVNI